MRLHQPVLRAKELRADDTRCAVCALRHGILLDAAHIVANREEAGVAALWNGLALARSVTPPTAADGLARGAGRAPRPELLDRRYTAFRAATA